MTEAPARTRESHAAPPPLPREATDDDIHLMLADARARAHQLIDESVVKAHDLLSRRRPATTADLQQQSDQLDRIKRAVTEVGVELRAIHKRLDTIETLLRRRPEAAAAPAAPPVVAAPTLASAGSAVPASAASATSGAKVESPETPQPAIVVPGTAARAVAPETPPADPAHGAPTTPLPAVASTRPTPPSPPMPAALPRSEAGTPVVPAKPKPPTSAAEPAAEPAAATIEAAGPKQDEREADAAAASPWAATSGSPAPRPPQARSASLPPDRPQMSPSSPRVAAPEATEVRASATGSKAFGVEKPTATRDEPSEDSKPPAEVPPASGPSTVRSEPEAAAASAAPRTSAESKTASEPASTRAAHDENSMEAKPAPSWSPALSSVPGARMPEAPKPAPEPAQAEVTSEPARAELGSEARPRTNGTTAIAMPAVTAQKQMTASAPAAPPAVERAEAGTPSATTTSPAGAPMASPSTPAAASSASPARLTPSTPLPPAPAREEPFAADGSPVTLRISPISGFQGLMRVQDTIVRLREVREAGVEAYARGEARMRVAISVPVSPQRIADALGESLGQDARIVSVNVKDHQLEVALRERPRGN